MYHCVYTETLVLGKTKIVFFIILHFPFDNRIVLLRSQAQANLFLTQSLAYT